MDPGGTFVGRKSERALFQRLLVDAAKRGQIVFVHGPGGIGKTALLGELAAICRSEGVPVSRVDGRHIGPAPDSFRRALGAESSLFRDAPRQALFVDTYEVLRPLDSWLAGEMAQIPRGAVAVIAGREPPSLDWRRSTAGFHPLALRGLSAGESSAFLEKRRVPREYHAPAQAFAHGHPLALTLLAEVAGQRPRRPFSEVSAAVLPDLMSLLLEDLPDKDQRTALEACAVARNLTEPLLAAMLDKPDAHALFRWLERRPFVERGPHGLFPHDLTREILAGDLRWRDPDGWARLVARAHAHYLPQIKAGSADAVAEDLYLHRFAPVPAARVQWSDLRRETATGRDHPVFAEIVRRHEGELSARLALYWLRRQPEAARLYRDGERVAGISCVLRIERFSEEDFAADPALRGVRRWLERGPLQPDETATLTRFMLDSDLGQVPSPAIGAMSVEGMAHLLTTPRLAAHFVVTIDADSWEPLMRYSGTERGREMDFRLGGRSYGMFFQDTRRNQAWQTYERMSAQLPGPAAPAEKPRAPELPVLLPQAEFVDAVHRAFRAIHNPERIRANPLLRSRLVLDRGGAAARFDTLTALLREACAALPAQWRAALEQTYFREGGKQLAAAAALGMSFSTYRRHLARGRARVAEILWEREISA